MGHARAEAKKRKHGRTDCPSERKCRLEKVISGQSVLGNLSELSGVEPSTALRAISAETNLKDLLLKDQT
jgi:hypothetical protein